MISLKSKETFESKTVTGVTFTVRRLNRIKRAARELPLMATRQRISALVAEYAPLSKITEPERSPDVRERIVALDAEFALLLTRDIMPAEIRAGLVSIDGLEIDGVPATPESLLNAGADYDALLDEIRSECEKAAGLSTQEIKNSQSDITSSAPAEVSPTTSNATPVGA